MEEKITIIRLLSDLHYMMGSIDGSGCKAEYDFVIEDIANAERVIERHFMHVCGAEVVE